MMVTKLKGKDYRQRLEELGITTLEERRERGDLIQADKVLTGKERVSFQTWFQICATLDGRRGTGARAGMFNVERLEGRLETRNNFWSVRVAHKWNQLPDIVKLAKTVTCFKNG